MTLPPLTLKAATPKRSNRIGPAPFRKPQTREQESRSKHLVHVDVHVEAERERQEEGKDKDEGLDPHSPHLDSKTCEVPAKRSSIPSKRNSGGMSRKLTSQQSRIFIAKLASITDRTNGGRTNGNPLPACSKEPSVLMSSCSSSSD